MSGTARRGFHPSLALKDGTPLDAATAETGLDAPAQSATRSPSEVAGNTVMRAAMSCVARCMQIPAERVEVRQVGPGAFQATVHFADSGHLLLSVALLLETGPRLIWQVEPLHP